MNFSLITLLINAGGIGGVRYSPEATAVFNKLSSLTTTEKNAIAAFVDSQVLSGNWDKLTFYQDYELVQTSNIRLDWIGGTNAEIGLLTGLTHIPGKGISFNGSQARGYLSNYNSTLDSGVGNDNLIFGVFLQEARSAADQEYLFGSTAMQLIQRTVASRLDVIGFSGCGLQIGGYATGFLSDKHYTARQYLNGANHSLQLYQESTAIATLASAGTGVRSNVSVYIGGRNDTSGSNNCTIGCVYAASADLNMADFITNRNILRAALAINQSGDLTTESLADLETEDSLVLTTET